MSHFGGPEPLTREHDRNGFDCGEPALNDWLARFALVNQAAGASRTFVALEAGRVVGYYALAAAAVERRNATGRTSRGMPDPVPAVLLARLAVDLKVQGSGLGRHLLRDAMLRTVTAADAVGIRVLLVHAKHEQARRFYERFGFEASPTDPLHLMLLLKDIRQSLEP